MGEAEKTAKKKTTLKDEIEERVHPPESPTARGERLAFETLVSLLDSESETIRLGAAQAILALPKAPAPKSSAADLVKKLTHRMQM